MTLKRGHPSAGASLQEGKAQGVGSSQVVLSNLGEKDFGHYRCTVKNSLGSNSTLLTLVGKFLAPGGGRASGDISEKLE